MREELRHVYEKYGSAIKAVVSRYIKQARNNRVIQKASTTQVWTSIRHSKCCFDRFVKNSDLKEIETNIFSYMTLEIKAYLFSS